MKVIKGGGRERLIPWYLKEQWTCDVCGCVFQPERGDAGLKTGENMFDGEWAECPCPTCGHNVFAYQPKKARP